MIQDTGLVTIFDAKAATGTATAQAINGLDHIYLQVGTASSGNLTCKFQVSYSTTAPDFSAAQSVSNHWDYVDVIDLEDGASIDGDTGFAVTGTDDFRNFEVNASGARWFCATVTARSAGSVTVKMQGTTTI